MAIALVPGGAISGANIDDANVTITLPSMQEGDVVYIVGGFDHGGTGTSPSIVTSGYTQLAMMNFSNTKVGVWRKRMGVTPDSQVVGSNLVFAGMHAAAYSVLCLRGVDATTQEDATTTTAAGGSASPDSPSITTVTDGAWVLSIGGSYVYDTAVTAPSGYSNATSAAGNDFFPFTSGAASKEIVTAGAEDPASWTDWDIGQWCAASVAVRPAAATVKPWYYYAQQ